ncbi:hypothetical protein RQM47_11770 [Rubrivirga sp. S365]|uniref:Negative regulator of flagellin synthesis n=1 Tax=Rubrivirga litoralis TaxID=3075598 RepID=A0ABU3BST6_9BACT|nr:MULTISPECIES: hypothetical protein [unclassified Rubrivirga]MDT0632353.1 hypothetical protein [Rubrivirga sp. F394]MDT7857319.1 hypothetical protein [Rubrivirga sp. S365]
MNLHRLFPGSRPAAASAAGPADKAERVRPAPPVGPSSAQGGSADRVELSDAARAQQAEASAHQAEVDAARRALHARPGLSDERLAELQQRVADGHYDRPEVVDATAARLAGDLRGEPLP